MGRAAGGPPKPPTPPNQKQFWVPHPSPLYCRVSRHLSRGRVGIRNPARKAHQANRRSPTCQAPQFPRHPLNPTKQTTNPTKISWPILHAINPQKRTIELVLRRANTMQENIRKIVVAAGKAGCPTLAVPLPVFRVCQARVGGHKSQPRPCLCPFRSPAHAAPPSPKRRQKCRKSAQNTPGNHPPTSTRSTTYEGF